MSKKNDDFDMTGELVKACNFTSYHLEVQRGRNYQ